MRGSSYHEFYFFLPDGEVVATVPVGIYVAKNVFAFYKVLLL
jgi:hypothetical protein